MTIHIIIPAYNEAATIGRVVEEVKRAVPAAEVIVVDDGSKDGTAELAKTAGARVLAHLLNRGQGAALATGTEYALQKETDVIVHFDADGQFEAKEIAELVEPISRGEAEVVMGSRFLKKENQLPFSKKYLILPVARLVNLLFTGLWLSDAHNGLRALSHRAAELIQIKQDRMAHNSEIVREIKKHHLSFKEIPVTVHYHRYGRGMGEAMAIIKDLILGKLL